MIKFLLLLIVSRGTMVVEFESSGENRRAVSCTMAWLESCVSDKIVSGEIKAEI